MDSLTGVTDSLAAAQRALAPLLPHADSLPAAATDTLRLAAPAAADLFGDLSRLATQAPAPPWVEAAPITENPLFQILTLALLLLYALLFYRYRSDIAALIAALPGLRSDERSLENQGMLYSSLLGSALAAGLLTTGVAAVKLIDGVAGAAWTERLPSLLVWGAVPLCTGIAAAVMLFQIALLRTAGALTSTSWFVRRLLRLKLVWFSLGCMALSPLLALYALSAPGSAKGLFYLILLTASVLLLLFLRETCALFVAKKISILHWFLYLCAVELFPVSFIVLTALRNW